jgi:hypothetical protein
MTHRHLLIIVLFTAIFTFDLGRPTDIDFWWHLRTGELIAHTGRVPTSDPFSFTAAGQPWVVHEWLWELAVYLIVTHWGYGAAMLLSAVIVTVTYVVLYRLLRRLGANEILAAALVLWAAALALPNLGVRPREVTLFFVSVYLSVLWPSEIADTRRLWLLPVLMLLWVNLHGAFVLGIGLVGLVALGETLQWLRSGGPRPDRLWFVGIATVAAAAVNPRGPSMLAYPFTYMGQGNNPSFSIVTEFQSPNFHEPMTLLFGAGLVLLLLLGVPRAGAFAVNALLAGVFVLQALISWRQVSPCALVLAPLLALAHCEWFSWARELRRPRQRRGFTIANWLVLLSLLTAGLVYTRKPEIRDRLQLGADAQVGDMPLAGARYIEENGLPDPVFNFQPWGGYLISHWYPGRRVFIDGRVDMYGADIAREYTQVATIKPEWRAVLDKYGVQTVLVGKDSPPSIVLALSGEWRRVFQGRVEDVFVRQTGG